jgi:hypothetical protein
MAGKKKIKKQKARIEKEEKAEAVKITKKWGIFIAVGIVVAFSALFIAYNYYSANFEYLDLKFSKVRFGKLIFYHAKIPLLNQAGEIVNYYNLYIRNDPRELRDIPINGNIKLKGKVIMASDELKCEDNGIGGGELGGVIGLWSRVIQGTVNKTLAQEKDISYVTCDSSEMIYLDSSVLIFKPGNVTSIDQKGKDCYEVSVKDCEVMRAVERFILGLYAHSKGLEI